jgi:hypothetical protein
MKKLSFKMDMDAAPNYIIPPVRTSQVCHFKTGYKCSDSKR